MSAPTIRRLASIKDVSAFQDYLRTLNLNLPCDVKVDSAESSLLDPIDRGGIKIGNRIAVNPMEGWDGTPDGNPSDNTVRRWQRFGQSGAKLIWGGEAAAVNHAGRANPNQVVVAPHTRNGLARMRTALIEEHKRTMGSTDGLVIGLQLTHSGRYCRPNASSKSEPRILYRHPILDGRLKLGPGYPLLTDSEIEGIIEDFHRAARIAADLGFDFVDVKHCHGYLGHEFLSARSREGKYGGSFENRTRFLREIVAGIRRDKPSTKNRRPPLRLRHVAIPSQSRALIARQTRPRRSRSSSSDGTIPYRWAFGVDVENPSQFDLTEPIQFLSAPARSQHHSRQSHRWQPLLQSPHPAPRALPSVRRLPATRRPARRRRAPAPRHARAETKIPQPHHHWDGLQLSPGFPPQRRASRRPRGLGRSRRPRPHGALVPVNPS